MFPRKTFTKKNPESTFSRKMSVFRQKSGDVNNFRTVLLHLGTWFVTVSY